MTDKVIRLFGVGFSQWGISDPGFGAMEYMKRRFTLQKDFW